MGTVRRAAVALSVPLIAAPCLLVPPAWSAPAPGRASAAGAGTVMGRSTITGRSAITATAAQRDPSGPVGGQRLADHGLVVERSAGVPRLPKIPASSFVIADADTGQVLAARDAHGHYLPASTLKVLTAIALIPKLDRDALIRPTQHACDVEGTKVGMTPKLQYRVSDLFKALIMVSGNDAALTLAEAGGGVPRTLAAMNTEARRLQAGDTRAGSPNGLDVDLGLNVKTQHTSAYDLALMMRQGLRLPDFVEYVKTVDARWPAPPTKAQRKKGKKLGGYPIYTHDRLVRPGPGSYRGMIGGKNGYTIAAQQTFVGAARRGDHTIVVSLMHSAESFWPYVPKMLDWGFAATGKVTPVGTLVDPVPPPSARKPESAGPVQKVADTVSSSGTARWGLVAALAAALTALAGGLTVGIRRRRAAVKLSPVIPVGSAPGPGLGSVPGSGPRPGGSGPGGSGSGGSGPGTDPGDPRPAERD